MEDLEKLIQKLKISPVCSRKEGEGEILRKKYSRLIRELSRIYEDFFCYYTVESARIFAEENPNLPDLEEDPLYLAEDLPDLEKEFPVSRNNWFLPSVNSKENELVERKHRETMNRVFGKNSLSKVAEMDEESVQNIIREMKIKVKGVIDLFPLLERATDATYRKVVTKSGFFESHEMCIAYQIGEAIKKYDEITRINKEIEEKIRIDKEFKANFPFWKIEPIDIDESEEWIIGKHINQ